jgi:High potential iron-sulfur protein
MSLAWLIGFTRLSGPLKELKMASQTRRRFIQLSVFGAVSATGLGFNRLAQAQGVRIEESDPAAIGLGYKHDAAKVDKAKNPRFAAGQLCSNCSLYQGKPTDSMGACAALPGKLVAAKGWCSVWSKKAA